MQVTEAVARTLAGFDVSHAFGVVGSGNFHLTNALVAAGLTFVPARHECGAAVMADAFARTSGRLGVLTLHQGPGLTNAMTGIAEAAKSRTPLLVLVGDTAPAAVRSNFRIDSGALVSSVGALPERVHGAATAVADTVRAVGAALDRHTVVLRIPLDVQGVEVSPDALAAPRPQPPVHPPAPSAAAVEALVGRLAAARRPVFIAGRGAREARDPLEKLAEETGALLATSAVAKGLFAGNPWSLDVCGGFASPLAAELVRDADLVVAWGCSLNMWTTRHGRLVAPDAVVVQVDRDADAIGAHHPVTLGVVGDVAETARALTAAFPDRSAGQRGEALRERIAGGIRWRAVPYADTSDGARIDPRTLSIGLDDLLPAGRVVAVDSGNFMGYPSMFLSVPDVRGFCFTQAFQSIGLGLGTAIGAGLAQPDRQPVAALGDGGFMMSAVELDTAVRLGLPLLVVIYNDEAYGAEVHHFGPDGHPLDHVQFPETDLAAVGRGYGCDGVTVRSPADLDAVRSWLAGPRERPLVVDAKVTSESSWWLEEAFRGH